MKKHPFAFSRFALVWAHAEICFVTGGVWFPLERESHLLPSQNSQICWVSGRSAETRSVSER